MTEATKTMNDPSRAAPGEVLLSVRDIKKYFPVRRGFFSRVVGHVKSVDGVSFDVHKGEVLGLVGESGCGKTTLARTILRLIEPTDGQVNFDGVSVFELGAADMRKMRKRMQIIFQDPYGSLNPRLTVGSMISEAINIHKLAKGDAVRQRVVELLDRVGLPAEAMNRYPHEFSGGQRQRIGIARALAVGPDLIIADEPVSALDVSIQAQILNLLQDLQRDLGVSLLFIAHDLGVVEHISDRVAVMYLGRIVEMTVSSTLYKQAKHPYTRALMSSVPSLDPERRSDRIVLEGDVPSPADVPAGCPFHTRCPEVMDVCRTHVPELKDVSAGHKVSCWLYDEKPSV